MAFNLLRHPAEGRSTIPDRAPGIARTRRSPIRPGALPNIGCAVDRPTTTPDAAAGYELAYQEGVRALSEQQAVIDGFRTRAGLLMSGAAIATSFLGGAALDKWTTVWTWLAVGSFILLGACVLAILWPRHDWEYAVRPERLIENYVEHPDPLPLPLIHRDLALHMDNAYHSPVKPAPWFGLRAGMGGLGLDHPRVGAFGDLHLARLRRLGHRDS